MSNIVVLSREGYVRSRLLAVQSMFLASAFAPYRTFESSCGRGLSWLQGDLT